MQWPLICPVKVLHLQNYCCYADYKKTCVHDIGCFSPLIDLVGNFFNTNILNEFMKASFLIASKHRHCGRAELNIV